MKWYQKVLHFIAHKDKNELGIDLLVIFKVIKIKLTNRFREGLMGYMFISIWVIGFYANIIQYYSLAFAFQAQCQIHGNLNEWFTKLY